MSMLDAPAPSASFAGGFDIRNPINYWVYLDGYRFAVGQTVADVADTPFAPGREGLLDDTLAANTLTTISFEYRTAGGRLATLGVGVVNPTNLEIPMMDARVRTLVIDRFTTQHLDSHGLMLGIQIGETTQEEIFALFGQPDDTLDGVALTWMYQSENWAGFRGSEVQFTFTAATDWKLSGVRLMSFDME
jgi:hypothetical protein